MDELPYSYAAYEYLIEPTNLFATRTVVKKAAQVGWTESLGINRVLYGVIVRRASAIYLLPTGDDVSDFSAARMNPAIKDSPEIHRHFDDTNNVGLKRAGSVSLYLRGTNSRSKLKQIPAAEIYMDEFDEMDMDKVELARKRLSGHKLKFEIDFSTPGVPERGIDREYKNTDQREYAVPCPYCGRHQFLTWPANIVWDEKDESSASYKCSECGHLWSLEDRSMAVAAGKWIPTNSSGSIPGFHINQLYSRPMSAPEIVHEAIKSEENEIKAKEFQNSVLGLAYAPKGGRLTQAEISRTISSQPMKHTAAGCTMGIDVGKWLYFEIAKWNRGNKMVLLVGKVKEFSEFDRLMHNFAIHRCVVDANPERRAARDFALKFRGRVYLAFYPRSKEELKRDVAQWDDKSMLVHIARTESLDISLGRFRRAGQIVLPSNIPEEYVQHHLNMIRLLEEEENKTTEINVVHARYIETGPDHFVHASNYNDVAGRGVMSGYSLLQQVKSKEHVNTGARSVFNGGDSDYFFEERSRLLPGDGWSR